MTKNLFQPAAAFTVDNASAMLAAGKQAIAAGQTNIDLEQVVTVDSSAVAVLLAWQRAAREQGLTLRLGVLPLNLQSLIDLYGVAALLGAPTAAAAQAS